MSEKVGLLLKDGDMEPFYVCDFFTLIEADWGFATEDVS
jgi:hypothetical protein